MMKNSRSPALSVLGGKYGPSCYISTWWRTRAVLLYQYMVDNLDSPAISVHDGELAQSCFISTWWITWTVVQRHGHYIGYLCLNITCIIEWKPYLGQLAFFSSSSFLIFPKRNMAWMISQDLPKGNSSNHCRKWHKSLFIYLYNEIVSISLQSDISLQIPNRNVLKCTQLLKNYNSLRNNTTHLSIMEVQLKLYHMMFKHGTGLCFIAILPIK